MQLCYAMYLKRARCTLFAYRIVQEEKGKAHILYLERQIYRFESIRLAVCGKPA